MINKKLLILTGDIAAGKTTFSNILSRRYGTCVFQKDTVKEILGDEIGFQNREENLRLSNAAVSVMCHIFSQIAVLGNPVILEANFHEGELNRLQDIAKENGYEVLTLVLRGDAEVLYERYVYRKEEENRHPVHLSTTLDVREVFLRAAGHRRDEKIPGNTLEINATDFSYQEDPKLLGKIDAFVRGAA